MSNTSEYYRAMREPLGGPRSPRMGYRLKMAIGFALTQIFAAGVVSLLQLQFNIDSVAVLLLVAGLIGTVAGYLFGQTIANALEGLSRGVKDLAQGQFDRRLEVTSGDEIEHLADDLNAMTEKIQALMKGLEARGWERTQQLAEATHQAESRVVQLEAVSQVARTIASVRDLDQILPAITRVISQQFGFYHVGIFLVDERKEFAILRAANSSGGQRMIGRGHKLRVEPTSIVGYAASVGTPRIALDVGSDSVFLNNPDLPETRSELALPLILTGRVIGVLDVQSIEPAAFTQDELSALSILANQVATVLENARLFSETRSALEEARKTSRELVGRDWSTYYRQISKPGYHYDGASVRPIEMAHLDTGMQDAALQGESLVSSDDSASSKMVIPIKLRGEVIGFLNIEGSSSGRRWTREEVTLAQAAAERAALALENARLVNEAQRRAAKERTIGEISGKLGSLIDVDNILQTAAQELGRTMPGAEIVIQFQSSVE